MWNFQTPVQGGSNELISKFLSSMIIYNHPSYFKNGDINSCRLSPLPSTKLATLTHLNVVTNSASIGVLGHKVSLLKNSTALMYRFVFFLPIFIAEIT